MTARGRPWPKGVSGNPGGSTRSLEKRLRDELKAVRQVTYSPNGIPTETDGYSALFNRMWHIAMEGEHKDSLVAIKLIYERTHGMPKQKLVLEEDNEDDGIDWDSLSTEDLRILAKVRTAAAPVDKPDGDVH